MMVKPLQYTLMMKIADFMRAKFNRSKIEVTKPLNMYQNIHKLPLSIFIDILTSKNYNLLIIEGAATIEQLEAQWQLLFNEYTELIGGTEIINKIETVKDIALLESKLKRAMALLEIIQIKQSEALYEMLYEFDYPLPIKKDYSIENLNNVLKIFIAHYKRDYLELQTSAMTIENNQSSEVQKIDYNYFLKTIISMSTGFKMDININNLSVGAYCAYVNQYKQYCETMSKQINND